MILEFWVAGRYLRHIDLPSVPPIGAHVTTMFDTLGNGCAQAYRVDNVAYIDFTPRGEGVIRLYVENKIVGER